MRRCVLLVAAFTPLLCGGPDPETVTSRRLFSTTIALRSAITKAIPERTHGTGSVLVVFRTSEQGNVIDARAVEGPAELRTSAVDALKHWRFKPTLVAGTPVQMTSALLFNFSTNTPEVAEANPLTGQQLSPALPATCSLALQKHDPSSTQICKQALNAAKRAHPSAMDLLSAEDEVGVALLSEKGKGAEALEHINKAIELAPQGLAPSDAEYADLYWHRALAEADSGHRDAAATDFSAAEQSMNAAGRAIGIDAAANYYRSLATKIASQRSQLAEQ